MLSSIFDQFVQESPVTVMARGLMEYIFAPERMDKLFDTHAKVQYQRELLFSSQVDYKKAFFVIRQHGSLGWKELSQLKAQGQTETGDIFEQEVEICCQGKPLRCRRVVVKLFKPTRDKELEIAILTNLSPEVSDTAKVAQLYRDRWSVETLFQTVTENFNGEIQTLADPKAALFSLAMAFATYNILATIRAVLGSVHGVGKVEAGLSDYYLVDEIQGTYRGMMISIPAPHWQVFETFSVTQMGLVLQHIAEHVSLKRFLKATRGEKKKRPPSIVNPNHRHVSTARLLQAHQTLVQHGFQTS